jgi:hypothetical protein
MTSISAAKVLETLKKSQKIENASIQGVLELGTLQNEDFDILIDLSFYNCEFLDRVSSWSVYHREKFAFKNCVFKGIVTLSTFTFKEILIEGCHFYDYAALNCGGFYGEVILKGNIFEEFADFEDQDIRGHASFINNHFKGGTNLMHPKGGPHGAHFAYPPYLEGNIGIDKYENGKRSSY